MTYILVDLTYSCLRVTAEIVVWIYDTNDIFLEITNHFTKYLKEGCVSVLFNNSSTHSIPTLLSSERYPRIARLLLDATSTIIASIPRWTSGTYIIGIPTPEFVSQENGNII